MYCIQVAPSSTISSHLLSNPDFAIPLRVGLPSIATPPVCQAIRRPERPDPRTATVPPVPPPIDKFSESHQASNGYSGKEAPMTFASYGWQVAADVGGEVGVMKSCSSSYSVPGFVSVFVVFYLNSTGTLLKSNGFSFATRL